MEASEEERQKLIELIEKNGLRCSPMAQDCFDRGISTVSPDFTVVDAEITAIWGANERNKGGMEIAWGTVSAGFGLLTVFLTSDGKIKADTEGMGKEFCKEVFAKLVDKFEVNDV